jgi:hypothetical protein
MHGLTGSHLICGVLAALCAGVVTARVVLEYRAWRRRPAPAQVPALLPRPGAAARVRRLAALLQP